MKAFHTTTSTADSATWTWTSVVRWHQCIALRFVTLMNCVYCIKTNQFFNNINDCFGFKRAHRRNFNTAHQPIESGHGSSIIQKRSIE